MDVKIKAMTKDMETITLATVIGSYLRVRPAVWGKRARLMHGHTVVAEHDADGWWINPPWRPDNASIWTTKRAIAIWIEPA
jgi:hypothetical protein